MVDINNDFEQNQLFEENTLITDKKMQKKSGSSNIRAIILTSIITSLGVPKLKKIKMDHRYIAFKKMKKKIKIL